MAIRNYPEMSQESLKVTMDEEDLLELIPLLQSCVKCCQIRVEKIYPLTKSMLGKKRQDRV